ncbi:lysophospholipase [Bifidobacterium lemurum]|uniref:Lysophospholipase n=2 Tax=Bifidobacterium lemurum TaxID=1603886 RepID=A0A261FQP3_9BIFI|nr:lysophospholipase [Bifidobacterium lemurum]
MLSRCQFGLRAAYNKAMQFALIDENRYAEEMRQTVMPALAACCDEGWFDPSDAEREAGLTPLPPGADPFAPSADASTGGDKLHYLCYDVTKFANLRESDAAATFRGAVVLSHGFTEFAEKYSEMIWYFLLNGYSVCALDHRGHGKSSRDMDNPSLVWIDDWRRYVADLAGFAQTIGRSYADGQPLNLYCHSMGGGIGAAVLERYPDLFDKAVLSCPMIAPATGMPNWLARALSEVMCGLGMGRMRVFGQSDFDGTLDLGQHPYSSHARERWYHQMRCDHAEYQTYSAAFEWVRQSLRLSRAVLDRDACAAIETPLMLFQAGHDVWVLNNPQDRFVERVRDGGGSARLVRIDGSEHEIFSMPNAVVGPYLDRILDFFAEPISESV